MVVYVGVDWGGTKIEAIALAADGRTLSRRRVDTPRSDYEGCVKAIVDLVEVIEAEVGWCEGIGIGLSGSLDPRTGIAKGASSTWMNGRRAEDDLRTALRRPVRTSNDADCFAVILGTGAGAGIAIDGRAHHGPHNGAGEWGHNPLPQPDATEIPGEPCYCGRHGCLETWVSGRAFARDYRRHAEIDLADPPPLGPVQIVERMRAGDRLARLVWRRYVDRVGRGLALAVNVLDPDVLVMGGGMSNVDELYTDLPPVLARYVFSPVLHTPVVRAAHGDSSGVRSAAWLWKP